jgi:hypothetical protein
MMQYLLLSVVIITCLQMEDASAEIYSDDFCVHSYICFCDFFFYIMVDLIVFCI